MMASSIFNDCFGDLSEEDQHKLKLQLNGVIDIINKDCKHLLEKEEV